VPGVIISCYLIGVYFVRASVKPQRLSNSTAQLIASENVNMDFWQRTWTERQDEVHRWFGQTEPPGIVTAFSWKNEIRLTSHHPVDHRPLARARHAQRV